jgi:hypothetical protein
MLLERIRITQRIPGHPERHLYIDKITLMRFLIVSNNAIPTQDELDVSRLLLEFSGFVNESPSELTILQHEDESMRCIQPRPPMMPDSDDDLPRFNKEIKFWLENRWHVTDPRLASRNALTDLIHETMDEARAWAKKRKEEMKHTDVLLQDFLSKFGIGKNEQI